MTSDEDGGLLTPGDAGPVEITNRDGGAMFLLLGDHAGNRVPERLSNLGLASADLNRHIALDVGISDLGRILARELDAPFIEQRYSRLVIDCNRALDDPSSITSVSDGVDIPGNRFLVQNDRAVRAEAIFWPYHGAISAVLAERDRRSRPSIVVSLHSFTPSLAGVLRPWDVGVLYGGGDDRFAQAFLIAMDDGEVVVGDNEPYRFDGTDFTVPRHAVTPGRAYVELEIRQDRLMLGEAKVQMAERLLSALRTAARNYTR